MKKSFNISLDIDVTLTLEELWPDGDAPENPTVEDVQRLIRDCGGLRIIRDWDLADDRDITVTDMSKWDRSRRGA